MEGDGGWRARAGMAGERAAGAPAHAPRGVHAQLPPAAEAVWHLNGERLPAQMPHLRDPPRQACSHLLCTACRAMGVVCSPYSACSSALRRSAAVAGAGAQSRRAPGGAGPAGRARQPAPEPARHARRPAAGPVCAAAATAARRQRRRCGRLPAVGRAHVPADAGHAGRAAGRADAAADVRAARQRRRATLGLHPERVFGVSCSRIAFWTLAEPRLAGVPAHQAARCAVTERAQGPGLCSTS